MHLDGFENLTEVARGGFGVVYRGQQLGLNREVAIKVLAVRLDEESERRFRREIEAQGALSDHPHTLSVHEIGVTPHGDPYIVTPYLSRGSLAEAAQPEALLGWEAVVAIGVKLAGALHSGHRLGIIHRDVKPANVLLDDYGEPALADFGIASITGATQTQSGQIVGTLSFSAPEILNGQRPDVSTDVYGLAATLFSLIAGRGPFGDAKENSASALVRRLTDGASPDVSELDCPDDLRAVVGRGTAFEPADRYASVEALGRALQEVQKAHGLPPTPMLLLSDAQLGDGADQAGSAAVPVAVPAQSSSDRTHISPVQRVHHDGGRQEVESDGAGPTEQRAGRRRWWLIGLVSFAAIAVVAGGAGLAFIQQRPTAEPTPADIEIDGIPASVFGARLASPDSLDASLSDDAEGFATVGAWWALSDWCSAEGFESEGRCYDVAADLLDMVADRDPRSIQVEDVESEAVLESLSRGYQTGQEQLDLVVDVPAEEDLIQDRPAVSFDCDDSCRLALSEYLQVALEEEAEEPSESGSQSSDAPVENAADEQASDCSGEEGRLLGDTIRLRSGPSLTARVIEELEGQAGTPLCVLDRIDGWYEVDLGDLPGWVFGSLIEPGFAGLTPAVTVSGNPAQLLDQSGRPTGVVNDSGSRVLVSDSSSSLWEVLLPDGRVAFVRGSNFHVIGDDRASGSGPADAEASGESLAEFAPDVRVPSGGGSLGPFTVAGLGDLAGGLAMSEVSRRTGLQFVTTDGDGWTPTDQFYREYGCDQITVRDPDLSFDWNQPDSGVLVMVLDPSSAPFEGFTEPYVARVQTSDPRIRTRSGIGVGSTLAEVEAALGTARLSTSPTVYDPFPEYVWVDFVPANPDEQFLMLRLTLRNDRVIEMISGLAGPVSYVEGCV